MDNIPDQRDDSSVEIHRKKLLAILEPLTRTERGHKVDYWKGRDEISAEDVIFLRERLLIRKPSVTREDRQEHAKKVKALGEKKARPRTKPSADFARLSAKLCEFVLNALHDVKYFLSTGDFEAAIEELRSLIAWFFAEEGWRLDDDAMAELRRESVPADLSVESIELVADPVQRRGRPSRRTLPKGEFLELVEASQDAADDRYVSGVLISRVYDRRREVTEHLARRALCRASGLTAQQLNSLLAPIRLAEAREFKQLVDTVVEAKKKARGG